MMLESSKPANGWVDVYVINADGTREFKQRVERPPTEDGLHELHSRVCRELSPTPMTPLSLDQVALVKYP